MGLHARVTCYLCILSTFTQPSHRSMATFSNSIDQGESIAERIYRITEDKSDLKGFFNVSISEAREKRLGEYYKDELAKLESLNIEYYDQNSKVDFILIKNYLERELDNLVLNSSLNAKASPLFSPFAPILVRLLEQRANVMPIVQKNIAEDLMLVQAGISQVNRRVDSASDDIGVSNAYRASKIIDDLRAKLSEWFNFYVDYDPLFTWWVSAPYSRVDAGLTELARAIREKLVHIPPDGNEGDAIVGEPIGRQGLVDELKAEMIDYSPEEILAIADREFAWCETQLIKISRELGYSDGWHAAMEYVKTLCVEPGQQRYLVQDLAKEAIEFVEKYDLVTIPPVAKVWPTYMMSPENQKINPFFLGGDSIIVSYPTSSMSHEDKMMSMKGNNIHFSRATVFHELIPGHHLQTYMIKRYRPYRLLFDTPFWIEGWSLYWEFKLWDDVRFRKTPENRMGMLFWRLHRCARILFSVNYHLGRMSPKECVDFLVKEVGHEPANAEGEVRRSLSGEYSPLYQAAYMLGALQIRSSHRELVENLKLYSEKEFNDTIMRSNNMPIGMLRALMLNEEITKDFKPDWRFYGNLGFEEYWTPINLSST